MTNSLLTLLPPIVAIALAVWRREVIVALIAALLCAEVLVTGSLFGGAGAISERLVAVLADAGNSRVLLFSLLMGGLIALMRDSGGVSAFVRWIEDRHLANTPRKASWLCIGVSVVLFVESTLSIFTAALISAALFDRHRMSRARLAYFVDSTCPPVKVLFPLNAWGALLLGLIAPFAANDSVDWLLASIPLNFYCWITLALVAYTATTGRVFGPMQASESSVLAQVQETIPGGMKRFFLWPIGSLIAAMIGFMWLTGNGSMSRGNASQSALWASLLAVMVAYTLLLWHRRYNHQEIVTLLFKGIGEFLMMVTIVLLAFALGAAMKELGTAQAIVKLTEGLLTPWLLAPAIFLCGCLISFATGTSWGTFAILIPIAMPMAAHYHVAPELILAASIGGGVFGDHCSGISDTAVLSSLASSCDHYEHVRTQLPYALVAAALTLVFYALAGALLTDGSA